MNVASPTDKDGDTRRTSMPGDAVVLTPPSDEDNPDDFHSTAIGVLGLLALVSIVCIAPAVAVAVASIINGLHHLFVA